MFSFCEAASGIPPIEFLLVRCEISRSYSLSSSFKSFSRSKKTEGYSLTVVEKNAMDDVILVFLLVQIRIIVCQNWLIGAAIEITPGLTL